MFADFGDPIGESIVRLSYTLSGTNYVRKSGTACIWMMPRSAFSGLRRLTIIP
jgi:hypothetical protein